MVEDRSLEEYLSQFGKYYLSSEIKKSKDSNVFLDLDDFLNINKSLNLNVF